MNPIRIVCFMLLMLLSSVDVLAQISSPLQFHQYGFDDGLPINPVEVIYQDQDGFMWFGSQFGLCRYNAYSFELFVHEEDNPLSLSHSKVTSILESDNRTLWVGTPTGLNALSPHRDTIARIAIPSANEDGGVYSLSHIDEETIVVGGNNQVFIVDPEQKSVQPLDVFLEPQVGRIISLEYDGNGTIWVGTENGLFSFHIASSTTTFHSTEDPQAPFDYSYGSTVTSRLIYDIHIDPRGNVWVGTWNGGLARYESQSGKWTRFPFSNRNEKTVLDQTVFSIEEGDDGLVWLGTSRGLYRMHPETHELILDQQAEVARNGLSSSRINNIFKDRSGGMWIATDVFLHRYHPSQYPFDQLIHEPGNPNSLRAPQVYSMCEGLDGVLWFGTHEGGLNSFDPTTGAFQHFLNDPADPSSIPDDTITALRTDPSGRIWVGTWTHGISLFDPETGTATRFPFTQESFEDPEGLRLSGTTVRAIEIDGDGHVWIGTEHGDLSIYNPQTGRFAYRINPFTKFPDFKERSVYSLFYARNGSMWVGSGSYGSSHPGLGLYRFLHSGVQSSYVFMERELLRMWDERIPDIAQDANGNMWFATQEGLSFLDAQTNRFRHYYPTDGFWGNFISAVVPARDGSVWVSTNNFGIARLDPDTDQVVNFGEIDGLHQLQYLSGSALQASDGTIYFGGSKGVTVIPQGTIPSNPHPPSIRIQGINVPESPDSRLSVEQTNTTFESWQNSIEFSFVALNYSFPERNQYLYRLLGLDEGWTQASTNRTAKYSFLPPGEYEFQVKGSNNDNVWSAEPATYRFSIAYPFWQQWWFRAVVILAILIAFATFYLYRVNKIKALAARLENEVNKRTSQLQSSYDYLETMIDTCPHMIMRLDANHNVHYINPSGQIALGVQAQSYEQIELWRIPPSKTEQEKLKRILQSYSTSSACDYNVSLKDSNGNTRTYLFNFIDHMNDSGEIQETVVFGKDITDHFEKEVLSLTNREQKRIGQDIHDSLCQTLTGLNYMCESLVVEKEKLSSEKAELLGTVHSWMQNANEQSRALARSLYVNEEEFQRIDEALSSLAHNIQTLFGIPVETDIHGPIELKRSAFAVHVYRIIQEAMSNSVKYSQAESVQLTTLHQQEEIRILVEDKGIGFDVYDAQGKGMGLEIMNYRAKLIGAALTITSQPTQGTSVVLQIPIELLVQPHES